MHCLPWCTSPSFVLLLNLLLRVHPNRSRPRAAGQIRSWVILPRGEQKWVQSMSAVGPPSRQSKSHLLWCMRLMWPIYSGPVVATLAGNECTNQIHLKCCHIRYFLVALWFCRIWSQEGWNTVSDIECIMARKFWRLPPPIRQLTNTFCSGTLHQLPLMKQKEATWSAVVSRHAGARNFPRSVFEFGLSGMNLIRRIILCIINFLEL